MRDSSRTGIFFAAWITTAVMAAAATGCDGTTGATSSAGGGGAGAGMTGGNGGAGAGMTGGSGGAGGAGGIGGAPPWCEGGTVAAKSCEQADVQSAIDSAAGGDTVTVPAGSCTWSGTVTIEKGISLAGAGEDATVITSAGADGLLDIKGDGGALRLTGMGFTGDFAGPAILINGQFSALRVDHCRFTDVNNLTVLIGYQTWFTDAPGIRALFDHITYSNTQERGFIRTYGRDASWEDPDALGTADAIFVEDSSFTWDVADPGPNAHINDGEHGARIVIRHTSITNGQLQWHDTGSTQQARGTRVVELYANTFQCKAASCGWGAIGLRGGTGVAFDNVIPIGQAGYENAAVTQIYRVGVDGGEPWANQCDSVPERICSTFRSHCSGGDHRSCGVFGDECNGIGACVDACASDGDCPAGEICLASLDGQKDASGWPCRDQTGRGQDDPVTHEQASAPFYWWNNTDPKGGLVDINVADVNKEQIKPDRDYYEHVAGFDGKTGVGRGPAAGRPAACTPGVGYFAADEGKLYQCAAGGTWAAHYTPFVYPHPLQAGCK